MGDRLDEILGEEITPDENEDNEEEEQDEQEQDDGLDDLFKAEDDDEEEEEEQTQSAEELMAEIERLKKERHGLYKTAKDERRKRQQLTGRLDQLTTTVNNILEQRQQSVDEIVAGSDAPTNQLLPIDINEEGDTFVDMSQITEAVVKPLSEKIASLEKELEATKQGTTEAQKQQEYMERLLSSKEGYREAHSKYSDARRWVNDRIVEWQEENEVTGYLTSGQALDYAVDKQMMEDFEKQFPDMDIVSVVQAEDSEFQFRRLLDDLSSKTGSEDEQPKGSKVDDRFQKVLKKPSGLAGGTNSKADDIDVMERLSSLTAEDMLNMSDERYEQLQKALAMEEQKGIKFRK